MQTPELTEIERLKLENTALKYRALEQQMQAILRERQAVIEQIETRLPGWQWKDPDGLVPAPNDPREKVLADESYPESTPGEPPLAFARR